MRCGRPNSRLHQLPRLRRVATTVACVRSAVRSSWRRVYQQGIAKALEYLAKGDAKVDDGDYDKADVREADRAIVAKNAEVLKKFDFLKVTVEGHCDERGTIDYNLALGERRAKAAFDYLVSLGIKADRLRTVSYGKEVPQCSTQTEECWMRNRRARFAVTGKVAP